MDMAVKFADGSDREIRGLAMPFGGPIKGKDIDGEDFGSDTDFCLDWFPQGRPILYHHGLNGAIKTAVVGRQTDVEVEDDTGAWAKGELDKRSRWYGRVKQLIDAGAVGFSSGAMSHLVRTTKSGHIERWPWVELSLTPTPANPNAVVYAVKSEATSFFEDEDDDTEPVPFDAEARRVSDGAKAFLERADARIDARLKAGREISASNREWLSALDKSLADLEPFRQRVRELLTRSDPDASKAIVELETDLLLGEMRRGGVLQI